MTPKTEKRTTPRLGLVCITHSEEVRYRAVTRAGAARLVREHLRDDRRVVLHVLPGGEP